MTANVVVIRLIHLLPPPKMVSHALMSQYRPSPLARAPAAYRSTQYSPRATVIMPRSPPALIAPVVAYSSHGLLAAWTMVCGGSKKL